MKDTLLLKGCLTNAQLPSLSMELPGSLGVSMILVTKPMTFARYRLFPLNRLISVSHSVLVTVIPIFILLLRMAI